MKHIYVIIASLVLSNSVIASSINLNDSQLPLAPEHTKALKDQKFAENFEAVFGKKPKLKARKEKSDKRPKEKKCTIS